MDVGSLGYVAALGLSAVGSSLGCGTAGMAAIGAWKKSFLANKGANMAMLALTGFPLSQTIYGLVVMNSLKAAIDNGMGGNPALFSIGVFGGLAIGASAWFQGKAAAAACDSLGETGKGLGQYIVILGVVETIALFVMAFTLTQIPA